MPIELWDLPEYTLGGRPLPEVVRECLALSKEIRAMGIETAMADELILFAELLGEDPAVFRDRHVQAFVQGDVGYVEDTIRALGGTTTDGGAVRYDGSG